MTLRNRESSDFQGFLQCWSSSRRGRIPATTPVNAYTAILDFIHPLSYLFLAAKAVHDLAADAWSQYVAWMRGVWRGEVAQVLEELHVLQTKLGEPPQDAPETDARKISHSTGLQVGGF